VKEITPPNGIGVVENPPRTGRRRRPEGV